MDEVNIYENYIETCWSFILREDTVRYSYWHACKFVELKFSNKLYEFVALSYILIEILKPIVFGKIDLKIGSNLI